MRDRLHLSRPPRTILERRLAEREKAEQTSAQAAPEEKQPASKEFIIRVAIGVSLLLIGTGLYAAPILIGNFVRQSSGAWEKTEGVVMMSAPRMIPGPKASYRPMVSYSYTIGPKRLSGKSYLGVEQGISRAEAEAMLKPYPRRTAVPVYYKPVNPRDSGLQPPIMTLSELSSTSGYLRTAAVALIVIALLVLVPWWNFLVEEVEEREDIIRAE